MEHDIENHPLWKEGPPLTDEDLDIIREALEKHVTTKLYHWYANIFLIHFLKLFYFF